MARLGPGTSSRRKAHIPGLDSLAFRFLVAEALQGSASVMLRDRQEPKTISRSR